MRKLLLFAGALLALTGLAHPEGPDGPFAPPVKLTAGDAVIDVAIGHADPFVADLNGDGKLDLLVGQFGQGRLIFYANQGTNQEPKLAAGEFLMAGQSEFTVPSG